jgi:hypothetical protein
MTFKKQITEDALIACGRHCCMCHKFCGSKIELHHIIQKKDNGEDSFDNCIPLCFDCHADVKSYNLSHPKGKQYTIAELKRHRDNWYKKVDETIGINPSSSSYISLDRKTYQRFTDLLKSDTIMLFLKQNDFGGGPFYDKDYEPIYSFLKECELSEFEFIDTDLEGLRVELQELIVKLAKFIGHHTFSAGPGRQEIPPEWEHSEPDRFEQAINDLNSITDIIWIKYDSFVKLARRKLYNDN